jgi:hypothetical protein
MKKYHLAGKPALFLLCIIFLTLSACNLEKGVQKSIDTLSFNKAIGKLNGPLDTLGRRFAGNAMMGLSDSSKKALNKIVLNLNDALTQLKLDPEVKKLLSAISTIGDTTSIQITKVGNTLHWQIGRLTGDLDHALEKLTKALDRDAKKMVDEILQSALTAASSPVSKRKIDTIISNLLDENTNAKAQRLVNSALQPTIDTISNRIDKIVHKDVPFIQKRAGWLLAIIGAIALAIIGFVWYQRAKYARLVKVLTYQIDKIPDKDIYNELTGNISSQTKNESLEPLLRKTLATQGINH